MSSHQQSYQYLKNAFRMLLVNSDDDHCDVNNKNDEKVLKQRLLVLENQCICAMNLEGACSSGDFNYM